MCNSFYFYFSSRTAQFTEQLAERLRFEEDDEWLCELIQYQWSNLKAMRRYVALIIIRC